MWASAWMGPRSRGSRWPISPRRRSRRVRSRSREAGRWSSASRGGRWEDIRTSPDVTGARDFDRLQQKLAPGWWSFGSRASGSTKLVEARPWTSRPTRREGPTSCTPGWTQRHRLSLSPQADSGIRTPLVRRLPGPRRKSRMYAPPPRARRQRDRRLWPSRPRPECWHRRWTKPRALALDSRR